jgi:hypothetical protein
MVKRWIQNNFAYWKRYHPRFFSFRIFNLLKGKICTGYGQRDEQLLTLFPHESFHGVSGDPSSWPISRVSCKTHLHCLSIENSRLRAVFSDVHIPFYKLHMPHFQERYGSKENCMRTECLCFIIKQGKPFVEKKENRRINVNRVWEISAHSRTRIMCSQIQVNRTKTSGIPRSLRCWSKD